VLQQLEEFRPAVRGGGELVPGRQQLPGDRERLLGMRAGGQDAGHVCVSSSGELSRRIGKNPIVAIGCERRQTSEEEQPCRSRSKPASRTFTNSSRRRAPTSTETPGTT